MRKECVQMSLFGTYESVYASKEKDKLKLFCLLDEQIVLGVNLSLILASAMP